MRTFPFHILLSIAILHSSCGSGPIQTKNLKPVKDTAKVLTKKGLQWSKELIKDINAPFDDALARIGDSLFICNYKGKVTAGDTLSKERGLVFDIKAEFMVDDIFISRYAGDFFVTWQETDHEGAKTCFASYNQQAKQPKWKSEFRNHPSPAQPVIDGKYAYVSTLGMVGKIDLDDGKFVWRLDSLFNQRNGAYKEIEPAIVYDNKVIFMDKPIPGKRPKRDTLVLNPSDGTRLR